MRKLSVLLAVLIVAPVRASEPKFETVGELQKECRGDPVDVAYCYGLIGGIATMLFMNGEKKYINRVDANKAADLTACIPASHATFESAALVQSFLNWADRHPGALATRAQLGVVAAIREAWPCDPRHP